MKICAQCNKKYQDNMKFCTECGSKLELKPNLCLNCGTEYKEGQKFCAECGNDLNDSRLNCSMEDIYLTSQSSDLDLLNAITDEHGVMYSHDGTKLLGITDELAINDCNQVELIDYEIKDGTLVICDYAFENCDVYGLQIPETLQIIGENAFEGAGFHSITLPKSLKKIGKRAFSYCYWLTEVILPEGLEIIEDQAFYACQSLKNITLPKHLNSIGRGIFEGCTKLRELIIPQYIESIGGSPFGGYSTTQIQSNSLNFIINDELFIDSRNNRLICCLKTNPNKYPNPGSCISVVEGGLTQLRFSIKIPNTITIIGNNAFCGFGFFENVYIPYSVKAIEDYSFANCRSLTEITLPISLEKIGKNAFSGCSSLKKIKFLNSKIEISNNVFQGCNSLTEIVVPIGTLSDFANMITLKDHKDKMHEVAQNQDSLQAGISSQRNGMDLLCITTNLDCSITIKKGGIIVQSDILVHRYPGFKVDIPLVYDEYSIEATTLDFNNRHCYVKGFKFSSICKSLHIDFLDIIRAEWETQSDIVLSKQDEKFGLYSISNKGLICVPKYNEISKREDGVYVVQKDSLYGVIDHDGTEIIPVSFGYISWNPWKTLHRIFIKGLGHSFIDNSCEIILPFKKSNDWLNGFYDNEFANDLLKINVEGKSGFINRDNQVVIDPIWDVYRYRRFVDGLCEVKHNGLLALIDTKGNIVCEDCPRIIQLDNYKTIILQKTNQKFYLLDRDSKEKELPIVGTSGVSEGLFVGKLPNEKFTYFYVNGEMSNYGEFDECSLFRDNIALVKKDGKVYILHSSGQLFALKARNLSDIVTQYAGCGRFIFYRGKDNSEDRMLHIGDGLLDVYGNVIIDTDIYTDMLCFDGGLARTRTWHMESGGRFSTGPYIYIDRDGKPVCKYYN